MSQHDRLLALVAPLVDEAELELYDLQYSGSVLSVFVDRPRAGDAGDPSERLGVDAEALKRLTKAISRMLDEVDPISARYSLEVSSPGVERVLRTPAHFAGAINEVVSLKMIASYDGPRRIKGTLVRVGANQAGDDADRSIDVRVDDGGDPLTVHYDDIDKARTVFEWGAEPKPKGPPKGGKGAKASPARRPAKSGGADPKASDKKVTAT
jgi:ribosome maturation factor RimP